MYNNKSKQYLVLTETETCKDLVYLQICKENASRSFTKKFSQNTIGFFTPGKIL